MCYHYAADATGHMFHVFGMGKLIIYYDKFLNRQGNYIEK